MKLKIDRKLNRLKNYNYSQTGYYFVTICTKNRVSFFGEIKNKKMMLNEIGSITKKYWLEILNHFQKKCKLDEFIIMPNHIHAILIIENDMYLTGNTEIKCNRGNVIVGDRHACTLHGYQMQKRQHQILPVIIGSFKSAVTKTIHKKYNNYNFGWQRSFYDHIIRDENSLNNIRKYIIENPLKWEIDENNVIQKIKDKNLVY